MARGQGNARIIQVFSIRSLLLSCRICMTYAIRWILRTLLTRFSRIQTHMKPKCTLGPIAITTVIDFTISYVDMEV
jgi:hypothetical protein